MQQAALISNGCPRVENRLEAFHMSSYQGMVFPDHLHGHIEILLPQAGAMTARVDGRDYSLRAGEALLVFPNQVHGYPLRNDCGGLMLIFPPVLLPDMGINWESMRPVCPVIAGMNGDAQYASGRLMQLRASAPAAERDREIMALVHLLVSGLLSSVETEQADRPVISDILYRAMAFLADNYNSGLSLKKTAKAAGTNEFYLSRLFNQQLHMDFRKYVNLLRMDKAKQYLRQRNASVEEIAFECGFSSLRTFDRVFLQFSGCTPREYRKGASS